MKTIDKVIFCVETNSTAQTDSIYIKAILDFYYEYKIPIKWVYMNGKTNYNKKNIKQKIADLSTGSKHVKVIYCIDTDKLDDSNQVGLTKNIYAYCTKNNFDLIWFCENIEEVIIGEQVSKSNKKKKALQFKQNDTIQSINFNSLSTDSPLPGYSNILSVLDKYFERTRLI